MSQSPLFLPSERARLGAKNINCHKVDRKAKMGSIRRRLKALEQQFSRHDGGREFDLYYRAIDGDSEAAAELGRIAVAGKSTTLLWQLFDAVSHPVDCHGDLDSQGVPDN